MNRQMMPTEIVEILVPKTELDGGYENITYVHQLSLMANIQPMNLFGAGNVERNVEGSLIFTPKYSIVFCCLLADLSLKHRIRWRKKEYEIIAVRNSTLFGYLTSSVIVQEIENG